MKTPSGRPASCQSFAIQIAAEGSFSEGLRITALPAAMAMGKNHIGTMAGKLKGEMIAATPTGWCTEWMSKPVEICSEKWPRRCAVMPHAYSTTSWPREISPRASSSTLPCSAVMISASSPLRESSSSRNLKMIEVRFASDTSRHEW